MEYLTAIFLSWVTGTPAEKGEEVEGSYGKVDHVLVGHGTHVELAMRLVSAVTRSYVGQFAAMVVSHFIVCCSLTDRYDTSLLTDYRNDPLRSLKSVSSLTRTCAEVKLTRANFIVLFADFEVDIRNSGLRHPLSSAFSPSS